MPAALELAHVVKDYPAQRTLRELFRAKRKRALHGVSFQVRPREVLALLGPNGSGKTTCVKILAGLIRPTEGRALVCGFDSAENAAAAQAHVGYVVSDERSFEWRLSAFDNLRFFGALHGLSGRLLDTRIRELGAWLAFGKLLDQPFRTLSSGQKARIAIARGLLHQPRALLLDEVTRTLDPGAADRLRRFVLEELVGQAGIGILLTTHDLNEARALASRVALLVDGRLRAEGTYGEVEPALYETFFTHAADEAA